MKIYAKSLTVKDQIQNELDKFAVKLGNARSSDITITLSPDSIRKSWYVGKSYRYEFSAKITENSRIDPSIVITDRYYKFSTFRAVDTPFDFCSDKSVREADDMLDGNSKWAVIRLSNSTV